jgi:hypothetical protein
MDDPIATLDLVRIKPDHSRGPIHVSIGRPRPDGKGAWGCSIFVDGIDTQERTIYGDNSMQALCLALGMIRFYLKEELRSGNRLVYSSGDDDFDVDLTFGVNIGNPR